MLAACPVLAAPRALESSPSATVAVPIASVFRAPALTAERVTQVLLGDRIVIASTRGGWVQVLVPDQYRLAQGYPGWMLRSQLHVPGPAADEQPAMVKVPRASLRERADDTSAELDHAFLGTRLLPAGTPSDGWLPVHIPGNDHTGWIRLDEVAAAGHLTLKSGWDVVHTALKLRGTRYLWGGLCASGIDCSGLSYTAYRLYGITLPRDADQQFQVGQPVDKRDLKTGDLVFFGTDKKYISHVGIYMSGGRFVEASGKSGVTVSPLSSRAKAYRGARRIIGVGLKMPPPSP